jgi:DNA mismatch repair protein MutL
MGQIQRLDDALVNKIAAGEVVERPASVIKELVENSIDAGAKDIRVELTDAGKKRILISDDGSGMDPEDARLALERHATSKIRSVDDLFSVKSMGFRGEALASIASVSRMTLMTCRPHSAEGVRLQTVAGDVTESSPWQSRGGTTIICDDLFFNVPVRSKFLKSTGAEFSMCLELMQGLALAHPEVSFTVVHNGKEQLRAPQVKGATPTETLRMRVAQVLDKEVADKLVPISCESQYARMWGLISPPGLDRPSLKHFFTYINGRLVKDKTLRFAFLRGYHSHLLKGKYPIVIANFEMDPALVDVNVHPAKTEVRLQYANNIQGITAVAVREALRHGNWVMPVPAATSTHSPTGSFQSQPFQSFQPLQPPARPSIPVMTPAAKRNVVDFDFDFGAAPHVLKPLDPIVESETDFIGFEPTPTPVRTHEVEPQRGLLPWAELSYLGSFASCYLLFEHPQHGLLVVDQHAFHERIIYERLTRDASLLSRSQKLLVPEAVTLDVTDIEALVGNQTKLKTFGFSFVKMSEDTIEIDAVPQILAKACLESLMKKLAQEASLPMDHGLAQDVLATMACHSAVRAGEPLHENEVKKLIREAESVDFYHNCPHGRRVFAWWTKSQVSKWFDRT